VRNFPLEPMAAVEEILVAAATQRHNVIPLNEPRLV
jgi:hypothetical protein